jgi:hypothetical protein
MEKNTFYAERGSGLRTSLSGWFESALHSLATTVGKYEDVGLGFNPLDVQVDEIERYIEPLSVSMAQMESTSRVLVAERRKCQAECAEWGRAVSLLGEMPGGPSTQELNGISLSQILELEPQPVPEEEQELDAEHQERENDDEYACIEEAEKGSRARINECSSHRFASDMSDLTTDDMTMNLGWGGQRAQGGEVGAAKVVPVEAVAGETLTTMAEKECSGYLRQLGRTCECADDDDDADADAGDAGDGDSCVIMLIY